MATASKLNQGEGVSATYGYDALGRRTRKEVKATAAALTSVPTTFVSAGAQEVIEITGDLTAAPWLVGGPDADAEVAGAAPYNPAAASGS